MALSREKKDAIVADLVERLQRSKITVVAEYSGLTVAEAQELRTTAKTANTTVKVVKNRLIKVAMSKVDALKNIDTDTLSGQVLYAFNDEDEVAPAQILATFARTHPAIKLRSAFTADGQVMSQDQVVHVSTLPPKDQLQGQLVGTIAAPLSGFMRVMSGNVRGFINVLNARAQEQGN